MKIYKLSSFAKWMKKEGVSNLALKEAIAEIQAGLFDANLGATVYKKRIARKGQGKRGGYRTLLAFRLNDRAIFLYGFAKNEMKNISTADLIGLKKLANYYMAANLNVIEKAIQLGELEMIK